MAIHQQDREDLLRSGLAMPLRGEIEINDVTLLAGFRPDRQLSLFCGTDPVFQFNRNSQLRRIYFAGQRIAAERGSLFRLDQGIRGGKVRLDRHAVDEMQSREILDLLHRWLRDLRLAADQRPLHWRVVEPQPGAFLEQLRTWLCELPDPPDIAPSSNA